MFTKTESSIDLVFDTNIFNIIIASDFNYNYSNISSRRKATSFFDPYGLVHLIDEPTHFTEASDSIIDILLARNIYFCSDDGNYNLLKQYVRDFVKIDNINTYAEDVTSKIRELYKLTILK